MSAQGTRTTVLARAYLPVDTDADYLTVERAVEQLDRMRKDSHGDCWYCGLAWNSVHPGEHAEDCIWRLMVELGHRIAQARLPQTAHAPIVSGPAYVCAVCRTPTANADWQPRRAYYDQLAGEETGYYYEMATGLGSSLSCPIDEIPEYGIDEDGFLVLCAACHKRGIDAVAAIMAAPDYQI